MISLSNGKTVVNEKDELGPCVTSMTAFASLMNFCASGSFSRYQESFANLSSMMPRKG